MGIRQERVVTLINAVIEYRAALIDIHRRITEASRAIDTRNTDKLLEHLSAFSRDIEYINNNDLSTTIIELGEKYNAAIAVESKHFASNWKRNEAEKVRARTKRADTPRRSYHHAPPTINESTKLMPDAAIKGIHNTVIPDERLRREYEEFNRTGKLPKGADVYVHEPDPNDPQNAEFGLDINQSKDNENA